MKNQFILLLFAISFLGMSEAVHAKIATPKKQILISVGTMNENSKEIEWKKGTCEQVYSLANKIMDDGADVTCRSFSTASIKDEGLAGIIQKYDYHLRILKNYEDGVSIDVTNIQRTKKSDFKTLGWNFKDGEKTKITKEEAMAKAIGNFFLYASNEEAYKAALLVNGAHESNEIEYDQKNGTFKDKRTGEPLRIDTAYSLYENESPRQLNYLRTGVEIGVMLSAAMAIYYKNLVYNQVDFDYGLKDGIKKKLKGEAIRFDDNDKFANYGHEYAGVMYYQMARTNGFNSLESFLITFVSSTTWEFMEYHEVLSINDEIMTSLGGYIIGEATYQISCALMQKNNIVATTLGYTINPGMATNHLVDTFKKKGRFASQPDCQKPRWSDISEYIGLNQGQKAYVPNQKENSAVFGMDATVVNISDYGKEGTESKLVYDTALAKMLVELNGNNGTKDLKVIAQVMSAAYHQKELSRDEKGQLRGYDLLLGAGSATTWNDRGATEETKNEDFFGTIDILGATANANVHYNGYNIKLELGFYGNIAMVKSYSVSKFADENPNGLNGQATTISEKGYYWGYGTTSLGAISVQKGKWEVGMNAQLSSDKSIKGHHRGEEQITAKDTFKDSLSSGRVFLRYQVTKKLQVEVAREYYNRKGSVNGGFNNNGTEVRTTGKLIYKF